MEKKEEENSKRKQGSSNSYLFKVIASVYLVYISVKLIRDLDTVEGNIFYIGIVASILFISVAIVMLFTVARSAIREYKDKQQGK